VGEELDPLLRDRYEAEAAAPLPSGAAQRVLAGVLERTSGGAGMPAGDAAATSGHAAATAGGAVIKVKTAALLAALSAALGAVAGIATDRGLRSRHVAPARVATSPDAETAHTTDATAVPLDATPRPDATPPATDTAPAKASSPTPRAPATTEPHPEEPTAQRFARESHLIDRARTALRRRLFDDALVALMRHERTFPKGQLREERDVLIIETYIAKGEVRIATRRMEAYFRTYPKGLHRERVKRARSRLP
jgi:hypothetical protein